MVLSADLRLVVATGGQAKDAGDYGEVQKSLASEARLRYFDLEAALWPRVRVVAEKFRLLLGAEFGLNLGGF
jgi:hypothetical protein